MDGGLVDAGAWGMKSDAPDMRDALIEMVRTMPGAQVLATIDQMTEQGMVEYAKLRAERGLQ